VAHYQWNHWLTISGIFNITINHGFQESTLEFLGFDIIMNPIKKTIKLQKNDKPTGMDDGRKIS
jgi:hypothetical protein